MVKEKNIEEKVEEEEKNGKVKIRFNGPTGWDLNLVGRGTINVKPGDEVDLNLHEPTEMRTFLQIIKEINRGFTNTRVILSAPDTTGYKEPKKIKRFEIVSGEENIPQILREHKYSGSTMLSDVEEKVVLELCPNFYKSSRKRAEIVKVM